MQLQPIDQNGQYQDSEAGTIALLSDGLFNELALSGYSVTPDEIETALIADFKFYAGWTSTYTQKMGLATALDRTQRIALSEWAILDPVIRAHCDMIQASRMEATGSLGPERFGLTVSEATIAYTEAKREAESKTFMEEPFFFSGGG